MRSFLSLSLRVNPRIQDRQRFLSVLCQVGNPIGTHLGTPHTANPQIFIIIRSLHVVETGVPIPISILIAPG